VRTRFKSISQPTITNGTDPQFSLTHDLASEVFQRGLRSHLHMTDRESRLCELIEYFGWEVGHRAQFATPWFYEDDPRARGYEKALGVDNLTFQIMHMYSLFNRLDPERQDFFWIYDGIIERLQELGGPKEVSVLDFGTGLGQIGLSFCLADYRTVMSDRVDDFLEFVSFLARTRNLEPVLHKAETDHTFFDAAADGHPFGLVVEWSAFEHIADTIGALEQITAGLVPGGMFVTTTFFKDWTPELLEHYRRDSQDDEIADQYLSGEADAWLGKRFDVLSPPNTIAKVLVRREF
jgi:2-polyprenyl-3-methyl-5-hydroxy-6-metoxy-1,4-benzoquinol methylase